MGTSRVCTPWACECCCLCLLMLERYQLGSGLRRTITGIHGALIGCTYSRNTVETKQRDCRRQSSNTRRLDGFPFPLHTQGSTQRAAIAEFCFAEAVFIDITCVGCLVGCGEIYMLQGTATSYSTGLAGCQYFYTSGRHRAIAAASYNVLRFTCTT